MDYDIGICDHDALAEISLEPAFQSFTMLPTRLGQATKDDPLAISINTLCSASTR